MMDAPPPGGEGRDRLTELLARIDERTSRLIEDVSELRRTVVTRAEFDSKFRPVQMIVFGLVALLLTGVIGAMVAQVVQSG